MSESSEPAPIALLITRNFPPLVGGMENVNLRLLGELSRRWRVALCGPAGCGAYATEALESSESAMKPLWWFLPMLAFRSVATALKLRPALVIAGSGLTVPIAWVAARLTGARLAVYLHGLDIIAPSRIYQRLWIPFFARCDFVLVNSANTARLASERGVRPNRIHVLHPGTEMPVPNPELAEKFLANQALQGRAVLLSVGRLTQRKGLAEFVQNCLPAIVGARPDAVLLVIGGEAYDALHAGKGGQRARIEQAARAAAVESHVIFLGRCGQADLDAAFEAANVHVFPVLELSGDVEGFGMVALEAAAHGLRTVAFASGGIPDSVDDPRSGTLVAPGDYPGFTAAVLRALDVRGADASAASRQFASGLEWQHFGNRLRMLLGDDNSGQQDGIGNRP
jgi:phosphatidylinositol alpha-1,6-mannosyltransferase